MIEKKMIENKVRFCFTSLSNFKWKSLLGFFLTVAVYLCLKFKYIWRYPSLSELTPMIFNTWLTHLGLEASK